MKPDLIEQALKLKDQIAYHDELFYIKNESEISDSEYDLLKVSLRDLLENNAELEKELEELSPSKGVVLFEQRSELRLVPHHRPFISLNRTYNFLQYDFYKKLFEDSYIELKLDGLAIELIYHFGVLKHVLTKGSQDKGEEINHNSRLFKSLPQMLKDTLTIPVFDIRCEAHLSFDDIAQLKDNGVKITKQRNQVSGWLRRNEPCNQAKGMITLSAYEASPELTKALGFDTAKQVREWLAQSGFAVPPLVTEKELLTQARNKEFPFDGYVLKANKLSYHDKVNETNKAPMSSLAFKYNTLFGDTVVLGLKWNVNKGQIVPRLHYGQVNIDDSCCEHANLFNAGNVKRLKLCLGDEVRIVMGGDCVPHFSSLIKSNGGSLLRVPTECPSCNGPVSMIGPSLVCNNTEGCTQVLLTTVLKAIGKEGLDIANVGQVVAEEWVGGGLVKKPLDIFHLEHDMIPTPLYNAIQQARKTTLSKFIYILDIPEFGLANSIKLSRQCNTVENFIAFLKKEFVLPEKLSPAKELSYQRCAANKEFIRYVERLALALEVRPDIFNKEFPTVVLTGGFEGSRTAMVGLLLKHEVEVVMRVTKSIKAVLVGNRENDIETASMMTAKKLGIPMIFVNRDTELSEIVKKVKAL